MSSKLCVVVNADTRPGWLGTDSHIGKTGEGSLQGVRSSDFLLYLPQMARRFFEGWPGEVSLVLYVDQHEELPPSVAWEIARMQAEGIVTRAVIKPHDRKRMYWNDHLVLDALKEANGADYVVHLDQDVALFRNEGSDVVLRMKEDLDAGAWKFICQPSAVLEHGMLHASTRFFICKAKNLDVDDLRFCLDPVFRRNKYGDRHCACLEAIIGLVAGDGEVLYPPYNESDWVCFSWVKYRAGLLPTLNGLNYEDVQRYIQKGALCGPMDFIPPEV